MLLKILQYTEQPTTNKELSCPNCHSGEAEKSWPRPLLNMWFQKFHCTYIDIFLGTLGKLPFGDSVLTDEHHLLRIHQFPHSELLGCWTWPPDGAHGPDTEKRRIELIFLLDISLEMKWVWILFGFVCHENCDIIISILFTF